jgi:tripartite-type tricarboxylate transporter receptor subunit TctC
MKIVKKGMVFGILSVFVACLFLLQGSALALDYPKKKIELVVAFSPGGGSDTLGRAVAHYGEKYIGQPIFVTNRAGGAGAVGFSYGAHAKPDGYVLTFIVTTLTIAPHITEGYPVTYEDFAPIALIAVVPSCISVRADSKYQTLEDVLNDAKKRPDEIRVGQAGTGSPWHLAGAALADAADVEFSFVPYKGAGPSITALLGGHLDATITSAGEIYPHVQSGKVRTLAIIAEHRFQAMPDVPTSIELGYDADVVSWRGIAAPKGTPQEIIDYLVNGFEKMSKDEEFINFLQSRGIALQFVKGRAFGDWLAQKHKDYGKIARAAGLISAKQ